MTRTPLRPGEFADCAGKCGRRVVGTQTYKRMSKEQREGVHPNMSEGRCAMCTRRHRRQLEQRNASSELKAPLEREWRERAACGQADPRLFEEVPLPGTVKRVPETILATALRFCQGCPVLAQCRNEADAHPAATGLLGGVYRTVNLRSRADSKYRRYDLLSPEYLEGI